MKVKSLKNITRSSVNFILVILLLLCVASWRGQLLGHSLKEVTNENYFTEVDLASCRQFLPNAHEVQKSTDFQFDIFDESAKLIGFAFAYKGEMGYGGPVPLLTFTNENNVILGLALGRNFESKEYLSGVVNAGILTKWNGVVRSQVMDVKVDIVSGATISSHAIIYGFQNSALEQQITPPFKLGTLDNIASLLLLFILTFACFFPKKLMKYRLIIQLLTVVVFGFWLGRFLSFVQIINWLSGGVNWHVSFIILIVLVLSILIPIVFGKAFYCSWVCPFGAAQELCGKACSKKIQIPAKVEKRIKLMRELFFIVLLLLFCLGYAFDLTLIEPFSAFSVTTVSYWMLGFATTFLIISIFIPKAWCRYFCPTGFILEWIRK